MGTAPKGIEGHLFVETSWWHFVHKQAQSISRMWPFLGGSVGLLWIVMPANMTAVRHTLVKDYETPPRSMGFTHLF